METGATWEGRKEGEIEVISPDTQGCGRVNAVFEPCSLAQGLGWGNDARSHGMEASTQLDLGRGGVRHDRRRCVATRCPPLGTHRRARRRRPRRGASGPPVRGRPRTRLCDPGAAAGAGSGPRALGSRSRISAEASLSPWPHARRKRTAGGVPRPWGDADGVTRQANRAAGRSPPAGRRPALPVDPTRRELGARDVCWQT
jgi:hypothetical protein